MKEWTGRWADGSPEWEEVRRESEEEYPEWMKVLAPCRSVLDALLAIVENY